MEEKEQWTYDDWLYNRIIPEFWHEGNKPHSLYYTLSTAFPKKLSQKEWGAIMQAQMEAWEDALNVNFGVWVKYLNDHLKYELVSDGDQFLDLEKKIIQKEIDSNPKAYQDVFKSYMVEKNNITGSDFSNIRYYKKYPPQQYIKLNIPEEDQLNFNMHLAKRKLEYLKGLKLDPVKDWKDLYNDLINGHYIADCSLSDFNLVMNEHSLPQGKDKIKWIGPRYTGFWFGKYAKLTVKILNSLFLPSTGGPFRNNDNSICKTEFETLMLKHFPNT